MVREALVASISCRRPPVRCQSRRLSTVPAASSPASARALAPATLSSSQAILVAEKYGSSTKPVRSAIQALRSRCRSQNSAVRRSCQTMAGPTPRPSDRSQTTVVSRWLVRPTAATRSALMPASESAKVTSGPTESTRACGSCSTQPGRG